MWNTIDRNNNFLKTIFAIFKILFSLSEGLRDCSSYIDINYSYMGHLAIGSLVSTLLFRLKLNVYSTSSRV